MNPYEYINRIGEQSRKLEKIQIDPTPINKNLYLDIIEKVVEGYGFDYFENIISGKEPFVICIGLRAAGALSYLLKNGRKSDWFDMWIKLMDKSCDELHRKPDFAENDLAVKEMMLALKNMKGKVDEIHYSNWYLKLKAINPYVTYNCIHTEAKEDTRMCNMTVYNMAGEYLRESEGMTDTTDYFDRHWPWALSRFDENGMFVDHDYPMLYDLTTRCQISVMLWYGYNGKYKEELDNNLEKAGLMTLMMQSSAFQLPYGGRSNQYLFNEALVASCCEYEAVRHYKKGNIKLAGMFKRCAHMSAVSILRWLNSMNPPKHNKNFFPHDSNFGIDGYGTYLRYMITLANFIGYGYIFADDSIEEYTCPSEIGGYAFEISKELHKVFANCCENSIEIELAADPSHDATGMGRYHKTGMPIELGLSLPFTATNKYKLPDDLTKRDIAICTGWKASNSQIMYISNFKDKLKTTVKIIEQNVERVVFSVEYSRDETRGCKKIIEQFTLDKEGVLIESELVEAENNEIYFTVPLLLNNGRDITNIKYSKENAAKCSPDCIYEHATVNMGDYLYSICCDGEIKEDENRYGNRNGIYKLAVISKNDTTLSVKLNLYKKVE